MFRSPAPCAFHCSCVLALNGPIDCKTVSLALGNQSAGFFFFPRPPRRRRRRSGGRPNTALLNGMGATDADGLSGSSNICFGRGNERVARGHRRTHPHSWSVRSFVRLLAIMSWLNCVSLCSYVFRDSGAAWVWAWGRGRVVHHPCVCTGCLSIVGLLTFLVLHIISVDIELASRCQEDTKLIFLC